MELLQCCSFLNIEVADYANSSRQTIIQFLTICVLVVTRSARFVVGELQDCDFSTPQTQDLSPVSQNSPISMGFLSPAATHSNPASGVASPTVLNDIIHKIHSRRFRE